MPFDWLFSMEVVRFDLSVLYQRSLIRTYARKQDGDAESAVSARCQL